MEANVDFYAEFFHWLESRSAQLVKSDPVKLAALAAAVAGLLKDDVALFKSLGDCFHGAGWNITIKVGAWVTEHPDPLKPTREKMRALRETYGDGK